jgi:hypothetical protein
MTDQEVDFASRVLIVFACILAVSVTLFWDTMSKTERIFSIIGAFVFMALWAAIG